MIERGKKIYLYIGLYIKNQKKSEHCASKHVSLGLTLISMAYLDSAWNFLPENVYFYCHSGVYKQI